MKKIYSFVSCMFLWGCIAEYNAPITKKTDDILVVEGIITNDTTYIILSKTVPLDAYAGDSIYVNNASLYIECDDGTQFPASRYINKGKYQIYTGQLNTEQKYRLSISIDGVEYCSEFLSPLITPEIDYLSWYVSSQPDQRVNICVSTYGTKDQSPYYLWSYQEDWEVKAPLGGDICWKSDRSHTLLLETTEQLNVNWIMEKKIMTMEFYNDRWWSDLYRIKVNQNIIRKKAYDYYMNLQKNIEQTGSIFVPIPSEVKGNIICITNSDIPVIGYVEVSIKSQSYLYISKLWGYNPRYPECNSDYPDYIAAYCRNCIAFGGSRIKPDDWPVNH